MNVSQSLITKGVFMLAVYTILYFMSHLLDGVSFGFANLLAFGASISLCFLGAIGVSRNAYCVSSYFLLSYFFVFSFSCFNLSGLQTKYDLEYVLIVLTAGGVFAALLRLYDGLNFPRVKPFITFSPNSLVFFLLLFYVSLKTYIGYRTGYRLGAFLDGIKVDGSEFVIPGISGVAGILQWVILMSFPFIRFRLKLLIVLAITTFSILAVKRGDIVRMIIFIMFYVLIYKGYVYQLARLRLKFIVVAFFVGGVFLSVFSYIGNARQTLYSPEFEIGNSIQSKYDNDIISWFFGYTGMNFEVLSRLELDSNYGYPKYALQPFLREDPESLLSYFEGLSNISVGGFNASTFLGPMIYDMGAFFWVELLVYSLFVFFLMAVAKLGNALGARIFLITLIILLPFGDHVMAAHFFYSILLSSVLAMFFRESPVKEVESRLVR